MKPTSYHAYHDPDDPRRIKDIIIEALLDGLPHDDIVRKVRTMYPRAQTTIACVRFYAWQLNRGAPTEQPRRRRLSPVGMTMREGLAAEFSDPQVLELIRLEHPNATTTVASIASTRSRMRKLDPSIPTSLEALIRQGLPRPGRGDDGRER